MKKLILHICIVTSFLYGCNKNEDTLPGHDGKIIVLMYHRITEGEATNLYERSADDLNADLVYLKINNIKLIDFEDLNNIIESGQMPHENSAIITFDDGDCSWYLTALPILKKHQVKATFFLWAEKIGKDSFLTWQEVQYMSHYQLPGGKRPFTFGSHGFSHQYLLQRRSGYSSLDEYRSFLDYEMGISKQLIEQYTPGEVTVFSLPFGDGAGDPEIKDAALKNGYKFIRTSRYGPVTNSEKDLLNIPSLPILDNTSPEEIGFYLGL